MITFDTSLLLGYYQSRTALGGGAGGVSAVGASSDKYAPTAPWSTRSTAPKASELVKAALAGRRFIDENSARLDLPGASGDYKKLFALYQGLNALLGISEQAAAKGVTALNMASLQRNFARGMSEVGAYAEALKLDQLRLTRGEAMTSAKMAVGVPKNAFDYVTPTLHTGKASDEVAAFQGPAAFSISVKKLSGNVDIAIDLADMGATPRTMGNVVNYINGKLQDAGVVTRFSVERTTAAPRTIESGGKTITLPAVGDAMALRIKGDSAEKLTFSAVSRPAVFVTTRAGDPDPDKKPETTDGVLQNSLLKIDPAGATAPETRIRTATLDGTVGDIRASQIGPDGALYMLADIDTAVAGQTIKGERDVALLKYDSAGKLIYARTLGAVDDAQGYSLAVSQDGKVAIAGAVSGQLDGATNGPINSTAASGETDSFVTLFDAKGDEVWTVRRGALQDDAATAVTFGEDGVVYVAGKTRSALPGAAAVGGWDSYITGYSTDEKQKPRTVFTEQFGTAGSDAPAGIVVDGGVITVAANEDGRAVLRSFQTTATETKTTRTWASGVLTVDVETYVGGVLTNTDTQQYSTPGAADAVSSYSFVSSAVLTPTATRDLGDLQGGSLTGVKLDGGQLYIAGQTRNAALAVDGQVRALAGGMDAFAARISTDLSSNAEDALAYYGGAGDNTAAGFAVAGGQVYLTGAAGEDLPGLTAVGKKDGYLAQVDMATGQIVASQRLGGRDGMAAGTSVAVSQAGASDLDKFGLPSGALAQERSQLLVSATAARAGDQFQIRTREGARPVTVTLDANETLDTLAAKIRRAAGFNAKVDVVSAGDNRVIRISPRSDASTIEILPGKGGKDVLDAIGLSEGIVRNTDVVNGTTVSTAPGGNVYGLGLKSDLNLSNADEIKRATAILSAALSKIRTAYRDLEAAAKPKTLQTNGAVSGPVPAYLQAQIANYQAGLSRLTGGG